MQTLILSYLTHQQPRSKAPGCWPACSYLFSRHGGVHHLSCVCASAEELGPHSWHACTSPSKAMHCRLKELGHHTYTACSPPGDWQGIYSPRICQWLGELCANPTWLLRLLKHGQLPGQRLKRWQAVAAEIWDIMGKAG